MKQQFTTSIENIDIFDPFNNKENKKLEKKQFYVCSQTNSDGYGQSSGSGFCD